MIAILILLRSLLGSFFKARARITVENLLLRHQLNIARRHGPKRAHLSNWDRWGLVWVYRIAPDALNAVSVVRPETVIRWHRQGFRARWRWKSRARGGRPRIPQELRDLVREIAQPASAQFSQQGPKLVGTGTVGDASQGWSVALSADGNTAILGGPGDNNEAGAAWVFIQAVPVLGGLYHRYGRI
jgi:hypothetical protein